MRRRHLELREVELRRRGYGAYETRDGKFIFLRHESDPHPRRWFVFEPDDEYPLNAGEGHTTLRDAANWAVQQ